MSNKLLMRMLVDYLRLMNKYCIDAVIVVEGKSDVSYLSSFIDAEFFITNGYDINDKKIDFLKRASEVRKLIIFTDNDQAGLQIETKIKSKICNVICVKTAKKPRKNMTKCGVAETEKEEILNALKPYISNKNSEYQKPNYNLTNVISLSDNPKEKRDRIVSDYRLINGNNKYLEQQLRILKIDVKEFNEKYGN